MFARVFAGMWKQEKKEEIAKQVMYQSWKNWFQKKARNISEDKRNIICKNLAEIKHQKQNFSLYNRSFAVFFCFCCSQGIVQQKG